MSFLKDYKASEPPSYESYKRLYQKRVDSINVCDTNERLYINVRQYNIDNRKSYEVDITAEKNGSWWILKAYSINENELNKLPEIELKLIHIFNALSEFKPTISKNEK